MILKETRVEMSYLAWLDKKHVIFVMQILQRYVSETHSRLVHGKTTDEWHMDYIQVHTSDMRVHTDDIRVHTSDIRMTYDIRTHTKNIRMTYEYIRMTYEIILNCILHLKLLDCSFQYP